MLTSLGMLASCALNVNIDHLTRARPCRVRPRRGASRVAEPALDQTLLFGSTSRAGADRERIFMSVEPRLTRTVGEMPARTREKQL